MRIDEDKTISELIFFKGIPSAMIVIMTEGSTTISRIARKINTTYNFTSELVKMLLRYDLIIKENKGRSNLLTLTDDGKKLAEKISELKNMLHMLERKHMRRIKR